MEIDIHNYTQGPKVEATACSTALLTKFLWYQQVYNESLLKGLFEGGMFLSISHAMRAFWGGNTKISMQDLARPANSPRCCQLVMPQAPKVVWPIQPHSNKNQRRSHLVATMNYAVSSSESQGKKFNQSE